MSVVKNKQNPSKLEFDNTYYKIYFDAVNLVKVKFGATDAQMVTYYSYIKVVTEEVLKTVSDIGKYIRIANSIYPTTKLEYERRRLFQDEAIGLCFDLLIKYQLVMKFLQVKDNKYVNEIKHIEHEINCIKSWRSSDNKRFKNIG